MNRAPELRILLPDVADPGAIDARVYEQDTELILRQDLDLDDPRMDAAAIVEAALASPRYEPGTLVVRDAQPLQMFAIVHDLDAEPSWRIEWIETALAGVFSVVADRGLATIAMPLLGTVHGRAGVDLAAELLAARLARPPASLERLWLVMPRSPGPAVLSKLARVLRVSHPAASA